MRELDYGKMGMRIRQVRKEKGWSQSELAKKCGISMSFLGHIERGSRIMSMETFVNICGALNAGADELLWGVACPSEAVLDMWNLPGKDKKKKKPDQETGDNRDGGEGDSMNRRNADSNGDNVTDGSAGSRADNVNGGNADSYAMYVKIMKSVAEIMNERIK